MNTKVLSTAILGAADGVTTIGGVIIGGIAADISHANLGKAAIAGAVSSTVSMMGGQWLSEGVTDWIAVGAMGAGAFLGAALPALPLILISGAWVYIAIGLMALLVGIMVGELRHRCLCKTRRLAYAQTLLVIMTGIALGYLVGRL